MFMIQSNNRFTGTLQEGLGTLSPSSTQSNTGGEDSSHGNWQTLKKLKKMILNDNLLTGTLPSKLFQPLSRKLNT